MPEGCSITFKSEDADAATSTGATAGMHLEQPLKATTSPYGASDAAQIDQAGIR